MPSERQVLRGSPGRGRHAWVNRRTEQLVRAWYGAPTKTLSSAFFVGAIRGFNGAKARMVRIWRTRECRKPFRISVLSRPDSRRLHHSTRLHSCARSWQAMIGRGEWCPERSIVSRRVEGPQDSSRPPADPASSGRVRRVCQQQRNKSHRFGTAARPIQAPPDASSSPAASRVWRSHADRERGLCENAPGSARSRMDSSCGYVVHATTKSNPEAPTESSTENR
jgi:hypothetical protein